MTLPGPRPTITEVARLAGVGRSSAARALGGYGSVSESTRERVLRAARELGYETNELARSMSTGETRTIGVVLADIANPFFAGVLRGITEVCAAEGFDTIVVNTDEDVEREQAAVRLMLAKQVDGIVVSPTGGADADADHLAAAVSRAVPVVQLDRTLSRLPGPAVVLDNREAAFAAAQELLSAGHRRIALAWGPRAEAGVDTRAELERAAQTDLSTTRERLLGYFGALDDAGLPTDPRLVMTGEQTVDGVARFIRAALASEQPPTAVVVTETDAALGVLQVLREQSLQSPRDLSLVGFDDAPWVQYLDPPLTVLSQPVQELGERSARELLALIRGRPTSASLVHLSARLVRRRSVAPLRS
ncbi:LacI family DNA-binding transcriptional regulator [Microbacterium oryzae]|uniref:LacI family DNA-binding transcriptional regulator n=1 Tax=Microbacterium oryzae TaxID=743009 RepID=UPI0025B252DC|nr:LacI family DNA-binding transcriptional regulator [Microbacterium oryzae]MDN3310611.1 LacI family DNA-binding transcriptional regulator [Microbacterium oryzae]